MPRKRQSKKKSKNKNLNYPYHSAIVPYAISHAIVTGFDHMISQPNIYNSSSSLESIESFNLNEDDPSDTTNTNENENYNYNVVQGSSINAIKMIKLIKN
jgi:hypothetical protein